MPSIKLLVIDKLYPAGARCAVSDYGHVTTNKMVDSDNGQMARRSRLTGAGFKQLI
jgi:hypothetical protein